ncbi:hypothetical protein SpCBS45565_g02597 [Spizellomyces sp. 'palustris']|nr:hypothetical protein SpCBS45565_g02597 [Spizellomyces sp. 'palustris']
MTEVTWHSIIADMVANPDVVSAEELLSRKYDKCLSNAVVKAGMGISVGVGLSFLFFKRKMWPIAMSTGFGLGVAYEQCVRTFNPRRELGQELRKASDFAGKP